MEVDKREAEIQIINESHQNSIKLLKEQHLQEINSKDELIAKLQKDSLDRLDLLQKENKQELAQKEQKIVSLSSQLIESQLKLTNLLDKEAFKAEQIITEYKSSSETQIMLNQRLIALLMTVSIPKQIFKTEANKIFEIELLNGSLVQRERQLEADSFIYWLEGRQICACFKESHWEISVVIGNTIKNKVTVKGKSERIDKFIRKGSNLYLALLSGELFLIRIIEEKLDVKEIAKLSEKVLCLVENEGELFVGTCGKAVLRISEGETQTLIKMNDFVLDLQVEGKILKAVDCSGSAVRVDLELGRKTVKLSLEGYRGFLFREVIGTSDRSTLRLFDWSGTKLAEYSHRSGSCLLLLGHYGQFTLLTSQKHLFVLNQFSFEVRKYETGEIPLRFTNFYYKSDYFGLNL